MNSTTDEQAAAVIEALEALSAAVRDAVSAGVTVEQVAALANGRDEGFRDSLIQTYRYISGVRAFVN